MSVSRDDLERLARLARLRLAPEERDSLASELAEILEHARALEELETEADLPDPGAPDAAGEESPGAPPGADPLRRPPSETAPAWRDGFFVVPRLAALDPEGGGAAGG